MKGGAYRERMEEDAGTEPQKAVSIGIIGRIQGSTTRIAERSATEKGWFDGSCEIPIWLQDSRWTHTDGTRSRFRCMVEGDALHCALPSLAQ